MRALLPSVTFSTSLSVRNVKDAIPTVFTICSGRLDPVCHYTFFQSEFKLKLLSVSRPKHKKILDFLSHAQIFIDLILSNDGCQWQFCIAVFSCRVLLLNGHGLRYHVVPFLPLTITTWLHP